jgi:hypothetical protein
MKQESQTNESEAEDKGAVPVPYIVSKKMKNKKENQSTIRRFSNIEGRQSFMSSQNKPSSVLGISKRNFIIS